LQERVASVVTQRVVDVFEAVEVEEQDAEHVLVSPSGEERLAQPVAEEAPVGKAGQGVMERLVLERVGLGLAFGDVAHRGDEQVARSDLHRADYELEWEQAPALTLPH